LKDDDDKYRHTSSVASASGEGVSELVRLYMAQFLMCYMELCRGQQDWQ